MTNRSTLLRQQAQAKKEEMRLIYANSQATHSDDLRFEQLHAEAMALVNEAEKIEDQPTRSEALSKVQENPLNWTGNKLRVAERYAMSTFMKDGYVPQELAAIMPRQRFASQTSTTTGGGYTIPKGFQNELEMALKTYGGMWEASRIVRTDNGRSLPWPRTNDTANKAYLISESGDMGSAAVAAVFGVDTFDAFKYTSGLILVPNELLEDSELFETAFIDVLAGRIYRGTNEVFTNGDGTNKPRGVTVAAPYGTSTADDAALAYDDFVNMKHTIDPAYRNSEKCVWMFHDTVLKAVEKIKDTAGQPVFTSLDSGIILGHPFVINNDMPAYTSGSASANDNKKIVLFGDFSKYVIRSVKDVVIARLPTRFGEADQTAFAAIWRLDGDLQDAGTHPIKYMRASAS